MSGGLVLSYKCSAACRHCLYACGPKWPADWIADADLEAILAQLAPHIRPARGGPDAIDLSLGLHFTGGEPFLNVERLERAVAVAADLGIPSTFVETNGFWCRDDASTRDTLRRLAARGLKGVMISVNPYYLEFVPFERTERAIRIGFEVFGDNTAVYQAAYDRQFRALGIRGTVPLEDYRRMEAERGGAGNVELLLMGRAPFRIAAAGDPSRPRLPAARLAAGPCPWELLRPWHNHWDNYGNTMPGYCGGISLGDCRRLDALLEAGIDTEERPVLGYLARDDMAGLLAFAGARGYAERPEGYLSKCHLCADLRRHLVAVDDFAELQPKAFYENLE